MEVREPAPDADGILDDVVATAAHAGVVLPDLRPPHHRQMVANGVRLHVLDWGPDDAAPLLFLHGGGLSAHSWDLVCAVLSRAHRCLAVDLRGHGDSEWPADADYRIKAVATDVAELASQLCATPPVVVGLSSGGVAAIHALGHGIVHARGLVVVDISPDLHIERSRHIREFVQDDEERDSVDAFVQRAREFNSRRPEDLLRRSLVRDVRRLPNGRWTWKADPRRMRNADFAEMEQEQVALWRVVPRITCPALVIRGERSQLFFPEDAERMRQALPHGRVAVVRDAGHIVHRDNPRGFLEVLSPFLKSAVGGDRWIP